MSSGNQGGGSGGGNKLPSFTPVRPQQPKKMTKPQPQPKPASGGGGGSSSSGGNKPQKTKKN
jgi:hypothetical protein